MLLSGMTGWTLMQAAVANPESSPLKFGGQLRARSEWNKKSLAPGTDPLYYNQLRTRAFVEGGPSEQTRVRVEIQDSRNFGSEPLGVANPAAHHTATIGNAKGLDLHQGYLDLKLGSGAIRLGRQKIALGSQRFISSLEWHPNARVFDGLRGDFTWGEKTSLTGILVQPRDTSVATGDFLMLGGLYFSKRMRAAFNADVYGFYDKSGENLSDYDLFNLGLRVHGKTGLFYYEEEFQYQGGAWGSTDGSTKVAAFYNATRLGVVIQKLNAGLGFDWMSGSNDGSGENTYTANYFFAHAYFGWMDYFLANPATGVVDYRLDLALAVNEKITLKSQNHFLAQAAPVSGSGDPYGMEFDLEAHLSVFPQSKIVVGAALLLADGGLQPPDGEGAAHYLYIMPLFNF